MTENTTIPFDASSDDLPDDIPLGNHAPLLVPPSLGQSFLQPKFIYPLGAVSLVNPDNLAAENDFELLDNSFDDSPFFDQPLQSSFPTAVEAQSTNQSNIQTKSIAPRNNIQRQVQTKRSPIDSPDSPKNDSIQRQPLNSSQAQPLNSQLNVSSQEFSVNPALDGDFQQSLDVNTSENISIQRSEDLSSTINITNSKSDRSEQIQRQTQRQIQRTSDPSSANSQNPQLSLNSTSPVLDTSIEQSNPDKLVQRQTDEANLAFGNNDLLVGDRPNQTESNLFTVDTTQSPQTDVVQRQSDSFTTNIQSPQIQLNSDLPIANSDKGNDALASDHRNIQPESNFVNANNISQAAQVSQANTLQRQANNLPVNNISQADLTQPIQRQHDSSISNSGTSIDKNTQPIQNPSKSNILDNIAESDHTIQQQPDLSPVDRTQIPQTDAIQRQIDIALVDNTSEGDLTQQIQKQIDLSPSENTASINTQQIQRFSESPVLDNVSQSDHTIQKESRLSNVDNPQSSQSDSLQKQSLISSNSDISNENTISKVNRTIQRESNLAATDTTQSPQADAIRTQPNISVDDVSQGDRSIQRETLGTVTNITQSDEIQRQTDVNHISQGDYAQQIQRQSQPDIATVDGSIDNNIQSIQKLSESPIAKSSIADNVVESDRSQQIQRQTDITVSDSSNSTGSNIQPIQRKPETPILDNSISKSDQTIHRETDVTPANLGQDSQNYEIQRKTDISLVDSPSGSDRATPQESNLSDNSDNNVAQSLANDEIQRKSDVFTVDNPPQRDLTIQRVSELSTVEPTQKYQPAQIQRQPDISSITPSTQPAQIQRQPDISSIDPPPTINSAQSVQRFSPLIASESAHPIQQSSTLSNIDIGQSSQNTNIQRQTDQTNIADLPESDSSPTSNNFQQIQSSEPAVLKDVSGSDQTIQRKSDSETTDRTIVPTDKIQRQLDVSVVNNISESERIQPIQRHPDTSVSNSNSLNENIQPTQRTSESPVLDNINQDNRRTIQREADLPSPADIRQDIQINEIQRQNDVSNANSIPEKDIHLSSTDIAQTPLTDNVQRQRDLFAVDNNTTGDIRTQQIQTRPDLSTSDISTNRDSQQIQRFSDPDISTVDQISESIQHKSSLSTDLTQSRQTEAIQRETDVSIVGSIDQSDRSIQREFDLSPTGGDITQSLLNDSVQRESVNAQVDNSIFSNEPTQQIQRQADLNISDSNSENGNIQLTQKTSKSPALDHITQDNHIIQREADLSPIDSTQVLQTNEIQRQTNISDVEGIAQRDLPIQGNADLSPSNSPQTPQIDIIQRQPKTSTVDNSTSSSAHTQQIQRTSDLPDSDVNPNSNIQQVAVVSESPVLDSLSQSDLTQQIQTKPEVSTSDISTNSRDLQQIQRIDATDISTIGSISEPIQQKPDDYAIDAISQGDRTIQRRTDLFNNFNNIDIPQSPQINDIQRQPDVAVNLAQEDISQDIQHTDPSISNSNNTVSSVEQIQREPDVSSVDIKQNLQTNELRRQTDLSLADSISQGDRTREIQRNSDLSPTDNKQISQANVIQKQPDISIVSNSISEDSLTQQIRRTSDLPNSDVDPSNNIQQNTNISEPPTLDSLSKSDRTQQIQTKTDISTSKIPTNGELQQIQRFVDSDISNVDINSENIQRRTNLSPVELTQSQADTQRQPDNISFADNTTQSDRTIQREADLFNNVDITQSSQTNDIQDLSNISIDSTTQANLAQKTQQTNPFIADNFDISNAIQSIQRELVDHTNQGDRTIQRESDLSPIDSTQILQTNEIQRQTDISEVDSIAQSDRPIQRNSDLSPTDSTQTPQTNVIQRHPDISTVDHNISEDTHTQQIQRKFDLSDSDITSSNIQQIAKVSESSVVDNLAASDRTQQIQTKPDISTSDISTNGDQQQIQRFVDTDISNGDINSENIQRRINSSPVELTQPRSDVTQRQPDISLANNTDQGDRTIQRTTDLFNNNDLSISDSNTVQQIQRDTFVDHTDQSDRTIQRENELSDVSAVNIEQDLQANEVQRQSDISSVNHNDQGDQNQQIQRQSDVSTDKNIQSVSNFAETPILDSVSQSDRNIPSDSDLSSTNIIQTSQTDVIQRQSDISTVDNNISANNRTQQIQTKADLSTSDIPDLQPIQRFSDANTSTVDINSGFSSNDITQSSQANDIQRESNILVEGITQGTLTQQTQQSDSPIDVIQRQSDISATDIPQSNHPIQQGSNLSTVNIKNDTTISPQDEVIQRQSDVSIVDNISENNSVIQREPDKLDVDITQSSVTNDIQNQLQSELQRKTTDSKLNNVSVDQIKPIQRELDPSEANNVDRTLEIDHTNSIQSATNLVDLNPEVSSQMSDNLEHNNLQQIQKKSDPKSDLTAPKKDDSINNQASVYQNDNQTIIQMLADPSNTQDLQLPKAIKNLAHTNYLGNSLLLPSSPISSPMTSQTVQRSQTDRPDRSTQSNLPNSLNNLAQTIQPKLDTNSDNSNSQTSSMGWSNISELLANLPSPKVNSSTSSLNKQTTNTSDRSPLATSPSSSSTNSTSNQTTIQRSLDKTTYTDNDIEQDLYLTPSGLQKGNPNKITNTRPNAIQRELTSDNLPEAKVSVNPRHDPNNDNYDEENFQKNLETLAQEIYILLRQRLEIEKERQGGKYQGRLPW